MVLARSADGAQARLSNAAHLQLAAKAKESHSSSSLRCEMAQGEALSFIQPWTLGSSDGESHCGAFI